LAGGLWLLGGGGSPLAQEGRGEEEEKGNSRIESCVQVFFTENKEESCVQVILDDSFI
jgi:hypothetical protein